MKVILPTAAGLAVEAWLIHWMAGHGDFLQKGEAWRFASLGVAAGAAYWIAARGFVLTRFTPQRSACFFWLTAVMLRLLIFPITPGDDVWRYRWEGMIQLHGFNPYKSGPESPELAGLRNADWSRINHRNYPAIYPPLAEAVFAGIAATGNALWSYKALFALADLACIAVLRRLLVRSGRPAEDAAWYAWNPLAVYAFAGAAHFDSLMMLALLGAVWALDECCRADDDSRTTGVPGLCWVSILFLGLAIAVKIAPLALLPVWAVAAGSWRRAAVLLPVSMIPLAVSACAYGFPGTPVFATLRQFGGGFRVNDPVWWLVGAVGLPNPAGSNVLYGGCALAVCLALTYRFRHDWRRGLFWVWGAALLLSPVVHAWYVVWVLPLAAWRGPAARAWFVFSISTFGYFLLWEVNHASGKPWREPLWLRLVILLPPLLFLAWRTSRVEAIEFGPPRGDDAGA